MLLRHSITAFYPMDGISNGSLSILKDSRAQNTGFFPLGSTKLVSRKRNRKCYGRRKKIYRKDPLSSLFLYVYKHT